MRGIFVTATDTGVGKTYLSGAIAAQLRAQGLRVGVAKPVLTGLDDPGPHDHERLGATPAYTFGPPVSPHLAAELAGEELDPAGLVSNAREASAGNDVVVVEGVGGLLVPLTSEYTVRDLARELGLPLVVAARPALGTINHTRLTLDAAAGLDVRAVVLTPWPVEPSVIERSNRETLAADIPVFTLPQDGDASDLPVADWLGP
ncbi:MAG: dethiobiotin synthase [Solirubrobacteraceae bacterium]